MKTIKGPAIFLAQFGRDVPPFNSLPAIATLRGRPESQTYCDDVKGIVAERGLAVTELSTHLQVQLVAVHPAYDTAFDGFAPPHVRGNATARTSWAVEQLKLAAQAARYRRSRDLLGLSRVALFVPLATATGGSG
jgi:sugar phosphate isomerase/epimerase